MDLQYNTNYSCKYKNSIEIHYYKNLMKTKNSDIDIEVDVENELYRLDLFKIFHTDSYDSSKFVSTLDLIYDEYIKNNQNVSIQKFKNILKQASNLLMSTDEKFGLSILYSFDYLDNAHKCICELIQTNDINEKTLNNLENDFKP